MHTIKNNTVVAQNMSQKLLRVNNQEDKATITYAYRTNISVQEKSRSIYEMAESILASYRQVLEDDASYIGTLGEEYEILDDQLSNIIKK